MNGTMNERFETVYIVLRMYRQMYQCIFGVSLPITADIGDRCLYSKFIKKKKKIQKSTYFSVDYTGPTDVSMQAQFLENLRHACCRF